MLKLKCWGFKLTTQIPDPASLDSAKRFIEFHGPGAAPGNDDINQEGRQWALCKTSVRERRIRPWHVGWIKMCRIRLPELQIRELAKPMFLVSGVQWQAL